MTEFELEMEGIEGLRQALDDLERAWVGESVTLVRTGVKYAFFLEFGTSKMDPKPFFRPAISELRGSGVETFINLNGETAFEEIGSVDELVKETARALRNRIQEIIKKKGLIRTGTLYASITAVPLQESGQGSSSEFTLSA